MDKNQLHKNYQDIAQAITYLTDHAWEQPSLSQIAQAVGMSDAHFQKVFSQWVGISSKKFLQFISLERSKSILRQEKKSVMFAAIDAGFSSNSRLHDLFITIESMTPGEYKNLHTGKGPSMTINYSTAFTSYGYVVIASTHKGLAHISFIENAAQALPRLKESFPCANLRSKKDPMQKKALTLFENLSSDQSSSQVNLRFHLKGTPFQIKVWESLLKIPAGGLSTYGTLAKTIGKPQASRAVGTAVGKNPLAYIIPCHRVIRSSGEIGNYMWGSQRKMLMIAHEAAIQSENQTEQ